MRDRLLMWLGAGLAIASAACACDGEAPPPDGGPEEPDSGVDAGQDAGRDAGGGFECEGPPGLYIEGSCDILAQGVRPYRPRFVLWSDGADKQRFIYLPPLTQIDTSDPDNWFFPVGTRIYKTFLHNGVRLETRVLEKHTLGTGPAAWYMRTYAWNAAQDRVTEVTNADLATRSNVLGTDHDIPSGEQCIECHSGTLDTVNSFSAIQLNHDGDGVTLQRLLNDSLLTHPIAVQDARIPSSDPTTENALGYLHANCGNCHRPTPPHTCPSPPCCRTDACTSGLWMWVNVGTTTPQTTATWTTAVGRPNTRFFDVDRPDVQCRIVPHSVETSAVVHRMQMESRGNYRQMPPLGTEFADPEGIATVSAWIASLPPDPTLPCGGPSP